MNVLKDVCLKVRKLRLNGNLLSDSKEIGELLRQFKETRLVLTKILDIEPCL